MDNKIRLKLYYWTDNSQSIWLNLIQFDSLVIWFICFSENVLLSRQFSGHLNKKNLVNVWNIWDRARKII